MKDRLLILFCVFSLWGFDATAGAPRDDSLLVQWKAIDSLQAGLPEGIRVFYGESEDPPLRAWYAHIEHRGMRYPVSVEVAADSSRREPVSEIADRLDACIVVNGGYFTMNRVPAESNGLLVDDGRLRGPATVSIERDSVSYETARAAIGISASGDPEITWATNRGDSLFAWDRPPDNRPGDPAAFEGLAASPWRISEAIGAGPMIVVDGSVYVTDDEEVFFGTSIPQRHPRTAAGITADGDLILLVVDGRQEVSIGVTLEELARLAISAGAQTALNLDGGGSSTLVVNGMLLNRPGGGRTERPVLSALAVDCEGNPPTK